jgi:hypothetical protein
MKRWRLVNNSCPICKREFPALQYSLQDRVVLCRHYALIFWNYLRELFIVFVSIPLLILVSSCWLIIAAMTPVTIHCKCDGCRRATVDPYSRQAYEKQRHDALLARLERKRIAHAGFVSMQDRWVDFAWAHPLIGYPVHVALCALSFEALRLLWEFIMS